MQAKRRGEIALRWLVGLAIGALFTWLSARSWPLDELMSGQLSWSASALQMSTPEGALLWRLEMRGLLAYVACLSAIHGFRVLRWWALLRGFEGVTFTKVNRIGAVSFMAVFMLPLRLGELARPWLLQRDTGVAFGTGLSTVAVERVVDGLMVSLLLFIVLIQMPEAQVARIPGLQVGAWAAMAVFAGASVVLTATALARDRTVSLLRRTIGLVSTGLADKITHLALTFIDGLLILRSPAAVAQFFGVTAVYWGVVGVGYWIMATSFGLALPVVGGYAMMCCVVVGMMIPNSPGNVGSFWYFMLLPVGLWGVDAESTAAVGLGLIVWLLQTLQVCLFGLWGLWARRDRSA